MQEVNTVGSDVTQWPTGRLLSTAARLAEHGWDSHLSDWQLNHSSFGMLALVMADPLTQRELAARLHMAEQTVSRTVERMERLGYVTRTRSLRDRRRVVVSPTGKGRQVFGQALADDAGEAAFETLGSGDTAVLRLALIRIVNDLSAKRWGQTS